MAITNNLFEMYLRESIIGSKINSRLSKERVNLSNNSYELININGTDKVWVEHSTIVYTKYRNIVLHEEKENYSALESMDNAFNVGEIISKEKITMDAKEFEYESVKNKLFNIIRNEYHIQDEQIIDVLEGIYPEILKIENDIRNLNACINKKQNKINDIQEQIKYFRDEKEKLYALMNEATNENKKTK